ncbi:hypothetical protein SAXI111661_19715 [Saccharomonospora xinjiangensis]
MADAAQATSPMGNAAVGARWIISNARRAFTRHGKPLRREPGIAGGARLGGPPAAAGHRLGIANRTGRCAARQCRSVRCGGRACVWTPSVAGTRRGRGGDLAGWPYDTVGAGVVHAARDLPPVGVFHPRWRAVRAVSAVRGGAGAVGRAVGLDAVGCAAHRGQRGDAGAGRGRVPSGRAGAGGHGGAGTARRPGAGRRVRHDRRLVGAVAFSGDVRRARPHRRCAEHAEPCPPRARGADDLGAVHGGVGSRRRRSHPGAAGLGERVAAGTRGGGDIGVRSRGVGDGVGVPADGRRSAGAERRRPARPPGTPRRSIA